jgi:hypothetical protein
MTHDGVTRFDGIYICIYLNMKITNFQVVGKSCKPIPVMILGVLIGETLMTKLSDFLYPLNNIIPLQVGNPTPC